jgi:AraC family transcriptional regulator
VCTEVVCTEVAVLEFMRFGCYARRIGSRELLVDPNQVSFFNPGEECGISHPCGEFNAGTSVRVSSRLLAEVLIDLDPRRGGPERTPFRYPLALSSPRCFHLQQLLLRRTRTRYHVEPLDLEELAVQLVRECLASALAIGQVRRNARAGTGRSRVETVQHYVMARWSKRFSLKELASVAGCSMWHLTSVFQNETGLPVYRYVRRLRLRHAMSRLFQGVTDLTQLALEFGFSSHSHFTSAFRCEFGITPSLLRDQSRGKK